MGCLPQQASATQLCSALVSWAMEVHSGTQPHLLSVPWGKLHALLILFTISPSKPHCSLPGAQGFLCTHGIRFYFHLILTENWRERGCCVFL